MDGIAVRTESKATEQPLRATIVLRLLVFALSLYALDWFAGINRLDLLRIDTREMVAAKREIPSAVNYDGLIFGDSLAHFALDPTIIFEATGLRVFNAALWSIRTNELPFYIEHTIKSAQPKKIVILGMSYRLLLSRHTISRYTLEIIEDPIVRWRMYAAGLDTNSLYLLTSIGRYREPLIRESVRNLKSIFLGDSVSPKQLEKLPRHSAIVDGFPRIVTKRGDWTANTSWLNDPLRPSNTETLIKILHRWSDAGYSPVIVCPPVGLELWRPRRNKPNIQALSGAIERIRRETSVPMLGCLDEQFIASFDTEDYLDGVHLNSHGATKFSTRVSRWLLSLESPKTPESN